MLAFVFEIAPQWHIYWMNSGDSGGPTSVQVSAPHGFTIGKTLYPRPTIITGEEGSSYAYEGKVALFVEVQAPVEVTSSQAVFNATINWMVCKDKCLLGRANPSVAVLVS